MAFMMPVVVGGFPTYLLGNDTAPVTTSVTGTLTTLPPGATQYRSLVLEGTLTGNATVNVWAVNPDRTGSVVPLIGPAGTPISFSASPGAAMYTLVGFPDYMQLQASVAVGTGTASVRLYVL